MLIFISYPAGRMKVKMTVLDSVITRGEGTKVALELDNPTSWILPKVAARIRYKNMLLGTEGVFVMEGLVGGKSRKNPFDFGRNPGIRLYALFFCQETKNRVRGACRTSKRI